MAKSGQKLDTQLDSWVRIYCKELKSIKVQISCKVENSRALGGTLDYLSVKEGKIQALIFCTNIQ
jgi:hypothetical protein